MHAAGYREHHHQDHDHLGDQRGGEVADDGRGQGADRGRSSDQQGEDHRPRAPEDDPERHADQDKCGDREDQQVAVHVVVHVDQGDVGPGDDDAGVGMFASGLGHYGPQSGDGLMSVGGGLPFAPHLEEDGGGAAVAAEQVLPYQAMAGEALAGQSAEQRWDVGQGLHLLDSRQGPEAVDQVVHQPGRFEREGVVGLDGDDGHLVAGELVHEATIGAVGFVVAGYESFETIVVPQPRSQQQRDRPEGYSYKHCQNRAVIADDPLDHAAMLRHASRRASSRDPPWQTSGQAPGGWRRPTGATNV